MPEKCALLMSVLLTVQKPLGKKWKVCGKKWMHREDMGRLCFHLAFRVCPYSSCLHWTISFACSYRYLHSYYIPLLALETQILVRLWLYGMKANCWIYCIINLTGTENQTLKFEEEAILGRWEAWVFLLTVYNSEHFPGLSCFHCDSESWTVGK